MEWLAGKQIKMLSKSAHISVIFDPTKLSLAWGEDIYPEKGPL